MAVYRCDVCNENRSEPICEKCGRETREIRTPDVTLERVAASIARPNTPPQAAQPAMPTAPRPHPAPKTTPPPPAQPVTPVRPKPAPTSTPPAPTPQPARAPAGPIVGLEEFEALLDHRKMKAIVICGDSGTGKSEIVYGYMRARAIYRGEAGILNLRATHRTQHALGATVAGHVWFQPVDHKLSFLDPSGEFFKQLSPEERRRFALPDVTEDQFNFMRKAVASLAGVVLVVDLTRSLGPNDFSAWKRQEDDHNFVLAALRWLRWDKEARPPQIGVTTNIAQRVSRLPRIDKPVLVLFSKADQLTQYASQPPLDLARRYLPTLHGALMTHAKRFRYDFCHTMVRTAQGDTAVDPPCGVLLSMEWLLRDRFRWIPLQLPTRSALIGGGK